MNFIHRGGRRAVPFIPDELVDQVAVADTVTVERANFQESWFEVAVDDRWTAAYRVVPQNGRPIIAEVRVFPSESFEARLYPSATRTQRHPGEWIGGVLLGINATVPAGGITTRLLRSLQTSETLAAGLPQWKRFFAVIPQAQQAYRRWGLRTLESPGPGGRKGWTDEQLLQAAVDYVEIGGRRPVAELAKRRKLKPSQARDLLQAAAKKGFLTSGRQGVASRSLTEHAKKLLVARSQK